MLRGTSYPRAASPKRGLALSCRSAAHSGLKQLLSGKQCSVRIEVFAHATGAAQVGGMERVYYVRTGKMPVAPGETIGCKAPDGRAYDSKEAIDRPRIAKKIAARKTPHARLVGSGTANAAKPSPLLINRYPSLKASLPDIG